MTLLEATSTLLDCVKTWGPDDSVQIRRAVKRMEKRLDVLQLRAKKALRRRRHKGWLDLQHLAPVCQHCGATFIFGDFAKTAELNHKGDIIRFDCPECAELVVFLEVDGACRSYMVIDARKKKEAV